MWWLFDASQFETRAAYGSGWENQPILAGAYIFSNFLVGSSFFFLSACIIYLIFSGVWPYRTVRHAYSWALFLGFVGLGKFVEGCGSFWWPNYNLFTVIHWCEAIFAVQTALTFPSYFKEVLTRPLRSDLEVLQAAHKNLQEASAGVQQITTGIDTLKQQGLVCPVNTDLQVANEKIKSITEALKQSAADIEELKTMKEAAAKAAREAAKETVVEAVAPPKRRPPRARRGRSGANS